MAGRLGTRTRRTQRCPLTRARHRTADITTSDAAPPRSPKLARIIPQTLPVTGHHHRYRPPASDASTTKHGEISGVGLAVLALETVRRLDPQRAFQQAVQELAVGRL